MSESSPGPEPKSDEFARQAEQASHGIVREFFDFLRHNKKWWLTPIIICLLLIGILVLIGSTPAAWFVYTMF